MCEATDSFHRNARPHKASANNCRRKYGSAKKQSVKIRAAKKMAPILLAVTAFFAGNSCGKQPVDTTSVIYDNNTHTIEEVAEFTGIDERAIISANEIDGSDETLEKIILPSEYSPLDDKIAEIKKELEDEDMKASKREELSEELESLTAKKEAQEELAYVYLDPNDDKKVFIIPKQRGISLEEIKDAFGIEDGVIRKYNDNLDYTWKTDAPEYGHYKDYSESVIPYEGITVPIKELYDGD